MGGEYHSEAGSRLGWGAGSQVSGAGERDGTGSARHFSSCRSSDDVPGAPFRVLSLCSGYGGLDLGVRLAVSAARTVGYVEGEAFAAAVLVAQMEAGTLDPAPVFPDLCAFDARPWAGAVDCVVAGFPCQPFSTASRGRRVALDIWPWVRRVVARARPGTVFLENVQRAPIERAGRQLARLGYRCVATCTDCAWMGAAHRRPRWWLLAHSHGESELFRAIDAEVACLPPPPCPDWRRHPGGVLGVDDGAPARVDRLRALGNGVVPQQAAEAFRILWRRATNG